MEGTGFAKLILAGEHAVVYGHPAIAMAVDRSVTVSLTRVEGPTKVRETQLQDQRMLEALRAVLPKQGLDVTIRCDFPFGKGMGSSAALAVALVRANARLNEVPISLEQTCHQAMVVEKIFHGNPSGLDHTVSARGGLIWYQKGPPVIMTQLRPPACHFVVLDSGSLGNTSDMVLQVARQRHQLQPILDDIGALVLEVRQALDAPAELGVLLNENHHMLTKLGVSTTELDRLATWACNHGAFGAKMAGSGGGGVVIALTDDAPELVAKATKAGVTAFGTSILETSWE